MSAEDQIPMTFAFNNTLNQVDSFNEKECVINSVSKEFSSSDDETGPIMKKRSLNFSVSESDSENKTTDDVSLPKSKLSKSPINSNVKVTKKSSIKNMNTESDSNSSTEDIRKEKKSIRTEDRKKKLKEKFKSLNTFQTKTMPVLDGTLSMPDCHPNESSDEEVSCLNIKEKIKKSLYSINSICDRDTSDDETNYESMNKHKAKSLRTKSLKPTSPKPMRMSAKQAMENMHKIKSESNRMLREKQVSLPYHRPKALSLKDIMNRRKPGVTSDGKVLPLKMNKEQLEQYVLLLEERQKEMIELCKSDSEQEEDNGKSDETVAQDIITDPILEDIGINHSTIDNENDFNYDKISVNEPQSIESDSQIKTVVELPINEGYTIKALCETKSNRDRTNEDKILLQNPSEIQIDMSAQEQESQVINLHYDSERDSLIQDYEQNKNEFNTTENCSETREEKCIENQSSKAEDSLDNIFDYQELDKLIEDAEKICENLEHKNEISDESFISKTVILPKPKLTGTPGTLINLDNSDSFGQKQLTGVELLKERFTYFAKLKSLEDMENDREKKFKPGTQHLKLKQELENQIAEQRSIEWEKRLEQEKKLHSEINDQLSDDDIEKLESKLETIEKKKIHDKDTVAECSESEEEPIENDIIMDDKPKKRNPLVDDEAEESDCDEEVACEGGRDAEQKDGETDDEDSNLEGDDEHDDDTSDSSSESEGEIETKLKKSRILKAFEDSDDENVEIDNVVQNQETNCEITVNDSNAIPEIDNDTIKHTLDEELSLAQINKSSDDVFSTQEPYNVLGNDSRKPSERDRCGDLGTQTFSILDSVTVGHKVDLSSQEKLSYVGVTQSQDDTNFNLIIETCLDSPSQILEVMKSKSDSLTQTQEMGDDAAALCTGKFYDNPLISQVDDTESYSPVKINKYAESQEIGDDVAFLCTGKFYDNPFVDDGSRGPETLEMLNTTLNTKDVPTVDVQNDMKSNQEKSILNSILEELDGPDFEQPKNKYFPTNTQSKDKLEVHNSQLKKRLVIDSDDEINDGIDYKKNEKRRKRKAEQRVLQISDDEDEELEMANNDFESDEDEEERIVEYDSEENEVEVQQKISKKKRLGAFFENEAELTSEDEWVGSGDEDERGLDRMEREEGDDDTFHQGQLRQELGQIHMREVLDQDKREVRLLQELLFEDGDLGDGHRQRKFRWRNTDGDEETGTNPDEFVDTQEDEFESEEQWRKQRHEREMFLRKLQEKDDADLDTSVNRTAIIKANICSRSTAMLIETKTISDKENTVAPEKKSVKDVPSPKKSFTIFQQNYHKSLLTRGRGALARLAALATPLVTDNDDAPKVVTTSNRRNFVFAALSQDEQPKVTKRKAENVNTPRLIKKMKIDDAHKHYKSTLFDHLKT